MPFKPHLFLDTSALFAGIWSAEGGARMLLKLGEAGAVQILLSSQVLEEIENVIRRKAAGYLPALVLLIDRSQASVVPAAPTALVERFGQWVPHTGDARILADAWNSRADYLVTLDKVHFLEMPGLARQAPFPIGTPGHCLAWYRGKLQEMQDSNAGFPG